MANYDVANARISGFSTFLGGISLIALILSINILTGRVRDPSSIVLAAETATVVSLLGALVLFFSSTVALVSAYTDAGLDLEFSVKLARRFIGTGVVLMFWGIGALLLVAFGLTLQAAAYAVSALGASVAFVVIRARLGKAR